MNPTIIPATPGWWIARPQFGEDPDVAADAIAAWVQVESEGPDGITMRPFTADATVIYARTDGAHFGHENVVFYFSGTQAEAEQYAMTLPAVGPWRRAHERWLESVTDGGAS